VAFVGADNFSKIYTRPTFVFFLFARWSRRPANRSSLCLSRNHRIISRDSQIANWII